VRGHGFRRSDRTRCGGGLLDIPKTSGNRRWPGERDCINHVHFRNVVVRKPYVDYTEVFLDDGQVDLFGVMKELVRQKYSRAIYPEHPRALDVDRERGPIRNQYPDGGGFAGEIYNVGYTRAMLQAALTS